MARTGMGRIGISPKRKRRGGWLGAISAAAAVVFALAGCALIPAALGIGTASTSTSASAVPKVGDCWSATATDAAAWANWKGSNATDCSKAHVLYTYSVGEIKGVTAKSWAAAGHSGELSDSVQTKAANACSLSAIVPKLKWNQQLVQGYFFVPSEAQWKSGARWVRCDIGVLAYGTTLADEALAKLPTKVSTLVSDVSSDPKKYDFCIDTPSLSAQTSPLEDPDGQIADCRQNPQWALTAKGNLPGAAGAAYPSDAVGNSESAAICSKYAAGANETWVAYLPTKSDWTSNNDRSVECWVGQTNSSGTSGGVA